MLKPVSVALSLLVMSCGAPSKVSYDPDHVPAERIEENSERPLSLAQPSGNIEADKHFQTCINTDDASTRCIFPYIDVSGPNKIEAILKKTIVSDAWQTERFKTYLEKTHPVILDMFTCTKSVMIAGDIRPSHFSRYTNSIYIDADYLAFSAEEKETVDPTPDRRSAFAQALPFRVLSLATAEGKMTPLSERDNDSALYTRLTSLFIHELAHACDFKAVQTAGRNLSDNLPEPKPGSYKHPSRSHHLQHPAK